MYDLTEDDKKRLTEFLGECWHEKSGKSYFPIGIKGIPRGPESYLCAKCNTKFYDNQFRTFTTWEDLGALQEKLVEKRRWRDFDAFALVKWDGSIGIVLWLLYPTRFCWLVSEYLKEAPDQTISNGFGSTWSKKCAMCGKYTMQIVRPGKVQCANCG